MKKLCQRLKAWFLKITGQKRRGWAGRHDTEVNGALLALFAFRHYGYQFWPADAWGDIFGLAGSVTLLLLVLALPGWLPLKAWICGEELLVSTCTVIWLADPWPFTDERCSAKIGFKLGAVGIFVVALLAYRMLEPVRPSTAQQDNELGK